jgi:uncharacterized protein
MALEGVMQVDYPAYVEVPRDIEQKAYVWSEFARGDEQADQGGEANKFVGGKMFLVRFGSSRRDPIWPIDIFEPQVGDAQIILGSMLAREIAGHNIDGASIGHLALGEYIYYGNSADRDARDWMQILQPEVEVRFPTKSLVSRRTFVCARAGFGKSNLNKLLFSQLYEKTPTVPKRGSKEVPVGTVVFDPDGEYFWPDDKGRPGLCDVPALEDKLVVFTARKNPSPFYQSFVAGGIKLDIRRLRPSDVIAIALSPDRQEQQNVRKLRGLPQAKWEEIVDLIDKFGNTAPLSELCAILDLDPSRQEAEALASRGNMTAIVRMLHDKSSQLMDMLIRALSQGKLCVIDVSQMRGGRSHHAVKHERC